MTTLNQDQRDNLSQREFAFPKQRKLPIEDAAHVRNAVPRFMQVKDVTDEERDAAWQRITKAAKQFGVDLHEQNWRELS